MKYLLFDRQVPFYIYFIAVKKKYLTPESPYSIMLEVDVKFAFDLGKIHGKDI